MIHFRLVRHGLASILGLLGIGVLSSCVSGGVDGGNGVDTGVGGAQGNAATGNVGNAGNVTSSGGSHPGTAGASASAGSIGTGVSGGSSQAGSSSSGQGGAVGQAGSGQGGTVAQAGSGQGGSQAGSSSGGTAGKGAAGSTGTAGSTGSAGATSTGPQPLPAITNGQAGYLTRFWDCCKPSCQGGKVTCGKDGKTQDGGGSACSGGSGYACYDLAPWVDPSNPYVAYAFSATNPQECGACYEIQFTGSAGCSNKTTCPAPATSLVYNTLFVQNINTGGDVGSGQFDLMIPGGGVGMFNACNQEGNNADSGAQTGGFLVTCNGDSTCYNSKCNSAFANFPDLLAGCLWYGSWLKATSNPQIEYTKVACPQQLKDKSGF